MPRRLPVRPAKIVGNLFVLFVILVKSFVYYSYVFLVWGPRATGKLPLLMILSENFAVLILLVFFHLIFFMLVWSFIQTMTTDPG